MAKQNTRRWARVLAILFLGVATLLGLEASARLFWWIKGSVPLADPDRIWTTFHPETLALDSLSPPRVDDETFDVLLLGGSTLHSAFGDIAERLPVRLGSALSRPIRVVNLANLGMTTRDSLIKHKRLPPGRFDLVILYHGINDAYLNNCPPGTFKEDYTHAPRFAQMESLRWHRETTPLVFPFTLGSFASNAFDRVGWNHRPRREWHDYGADVRTEKPFESNLRALLALAANRNETVMVTTYAWHLPADYSPDAFAQKKLDYGRHASPVELWGRPDHVAEAIKRHNQVIRRIVAERRDLLFVDIESEIPKSKEFFDDICHLTKTGCERWTAAVVESITRPGRERPALATKPTDRR